MIIAKFEVIEDCQRSTLGGNQITNEVFLLEEYHSTKCGSDLQTFKYDVLENLGLQISGISRLQTPSMLVSILIQHSYLHQVLLPILQFIPFVATFAAGPITHKIPASSN